jgi:plasmid stabilization system protein ParE
MADLPIEFHADATEEYLSALAWYREQSPKAAENFAKAFDQAIEHIQQSPGRWPVYFKLCRRYTLRRFPFTIVYQSKPFETFVVAVAHASRRPRYWRGRV